MLRPPVHLTNTVFMVPPAGFGVNPETARSNSFQTSDIPSPADAARALVEYENLVSLLQSNGVRVVQPDGSVRRQAPDAHFPNNWFSTHEDGTVAVYPLLSPLRRNERDPGVMSSLQRLFEVRAVADLSEAEHEGRFLEGTGSLVLDRTGRVAYAALSPRTEPSLVEEFCSKFAYRSCTFETTDDSGQAIYHTNVVMSVGERFAVVGFANFVHKAERQAVSESLLRTGREVIALSRRQVANFAGNLLQLRLGGGVSGIAISSRGWASLDARQQQALAEHGKVLAADVSTIEKFGGGSVRCMIAEIFLEPRGGVEAQ